MVKKSLYILLLSLIATLTSCHHKDLCYHHPHSGNLRVVFDWKDAPDAYAQGMVVFFYPLDGGNPIRVDYAGMEGGTVELTNGKYRVMTYNNDTECIQFYSTNDFFKHGFFTRESSPIEPIVGNGGYSLVSKSDEEPADGDAETQEENKRTERCVLAPDMMWGCVAEIELDENGVKYISIPESERATADETPVSTEYTIVLYPHELTCIYTYEVKNVKNLKYMQQCCGVIWGMAGELQMYEEVLSDEPVTIPFASAKSGESSIIGTFFTFGHNTAVEDTHIMQFYVIMNDGNKLLFPNTKEDPKADRFDVTDQVHNAPNKRRVHIVIDGLDLPEAITEGSGFLPTVDDWDVVETDINL
ncbi:MAG: DUF5119 domain-containing protein [Muribaculaceae bacterium]